MAEDYVAEKVSKYPLLIVGTLLVLVVILVTLYLSAIGRFDIMANLQEIWFWVANALITLGIALIVKGLYGRKVTRGVGPEPTKPNVTPTIPTLVEPTKSRIAIRNQTFRNENVNLDGRTWIGCKFIDCNIFLNVGDFDILGCEFSHSGFNFGPNALGILRIAVAFPKLLDEVKGDLAKHNIKVEGSDQTSAGKDKQEGTKPSS